MKVMLLCLALFTCTEPQDLQNMKEISKNNMTVKWKIEKEHIHFEMEAPTDGWVAIGFNETSALAGTYLLMGRIRNGTAEVVEHYTERPGSYQPTTNYGVPVQVFSVTGDEKGKMTRLNYSIPIEKASKYHKQLSPETKWTLLMAYSLEDDFQHHSIVRTSVEIKL